MLAALFGFLWWAGCGILWLAEMLGKFAAFVALWRWWRGHKRDDAQGETEAQATRRAVVAKLKGQG